jgi:hypothetical protein
VPCVKCANKSSPDAVRSEPVIFRCDSSSAAGPSPAAGPLAHSRSGHKGRPYQAIIRAAALLALGIGGPATASAQVSTRISSDAPIVNFRLPTFTPDGYREWLVRGTEARMHSLKDIDVRELTLTVFAGDATEKISTMILAAEAKVQPETRTVTGPASIRVISDELEASGADWRVHQPADKTVEISMRRNVRVTFRAELKNLLQ